jgi:hypothetical protein
MAGSWNDPNVARARAKWLDLGMAEVELKLN